jgi:hypothetical protein
MPNQHLHAIIALEGIHLPGERIVPEDRVGVLSKCGVPQIPDVGLGLVPSHVVGNEARAVGDEP